MFLSGAGQTRPLFLFLIACPYFFSVLFLLTYKKKKKLLGEKMQNFVFCFFSFFLLITFYISYVFLPNILVYCALIEYAYI